MQKTMSANNNICTKMYPYNLHDVSYFFINIIKEIKAYGLILSFERLLYILHSNNARKISFVDKK